MFLYPPFSEDSSHCLLKQPPQFDKLQILAHCSVNHQPAPRTNVQDHFRAFPDIAVHVIVPFPLRPVARAAVHPYTNMTSHCLWAHLELPARYKSTSLQCQLLNAICRGGAYHTLNLPSCCQWQKSLAFYISLIPRSSRCCSSLKKKKVNVKFYSTHLCTYEEYKV